MKKLHVFLAFSLAFVMLVLGGKLSAQTASDQPRPQEGEQGWARLNSGTTVDLERVFMFGEDTAWVVSWETTILYTSDGGDSWTKKSVPDGYKGALFTSPTVGYAVTYGKLRKTLDGGDSWGEEKSIKGLNLPQVLNVGQDTLFAMDGSSFGRSTDGGKTWKVEQDPLASSNDMFFDDHRRGVLVGVAMTVKEPPYPIWGELSTTTDGGETWHKRYSQVPHDLLDVITFDWKHVFLIASLNPGYMFLRSSDGALTWDSVKLTTSALGMYFQDTLRGFIVGSKGAIIATTDGGFTWNQQRSSIQQGIDIPESIGLHDVTFANDSIGIAVGREGTILRTRNRGTSSVQSTRWESTFIVESQFDPQTNTLRLSAPRLPVGPLAIQITDLSGRVLYRLLTTSTGVGFLHSIEASQFASGVYLYSVEIAGQMASGKVIITR